MTNYTTEDIALLRDAISFTLSNLDELNEAKGKELTNEERSKQEDEYMQLMAKTFATKPPSELTPDQTTLLLKSLEYACNNSDAIEGSFQQQDIFDLIIYFSPKLKSSHGIPDDQESPTS